MYGGGGRNHNSSFGRIPPRWLKCPRKSMSFVADKFCVFKTPLSSSYDDSVPQEDRWNTAMVSSYFKHNKQKLGLWIDLTNTDRYYSKDDVEKQGIIYMKLNCVGREGAPSQEQINAFIGVCKNFIEKNPTQIIGVHCTHGFNRSGFLICAFLVQEMDWGIDVALQQFAKARPPGIYKQDYINKLFQLYADDDDMTPPTKPELPDWCFEDQDVNDDDGFSRLHSLSSAPSTSNDRNYNNNNNNNKRTFDTMNESPSNGSRSNGFKKRRGEIVKANPTFMEGVPGVEPVTDRDEVQRLQQKVQEMCEWRGTGFPGSQPVSMDVNNIRFLHTSPYMVSWKADGTRYLMLIEDRDKVYFFDRDNCVFQAIGMTFPYRRNPIEHLTETLVDGEMVIDKHEDKTFPRYLIYDIIKFRGEDVGKTDFKTRLICIEKEIVQERYRAINNGEICRESEPFGVRLKHFWPLDKTEDLLRGRFSKQLPHEPDGAVFQPVKEPYTPGRCDSVLKWKPPELNTIDFRLQISTQCGEGLLPTKLGDLYVGQKKSSHSGIQQQPFGRLKKVTKEVAKLDGKILECRWDGSGWIFLRERTDKSFPNAFSTAEAVWSTIKNPVTLEYLLDFIQRYQFRRP